MPGFLPGLAIGGDIGPQLLDRPEPHRDKHRMAELGDGREGIGAVGGDADFRPRLLIGLWRQRDIVEAVVFALVREARLGPGALQNLQCLGEALAAFAIGHAVSLVGTRKTAASDAKYKAA